MLSWPPTAYQAVTGILVSLFVSFMTLDIFNTIHAEGRKNSFSIMAAADFFRRIGWFLYFTAVFLWECIKSNIDVAWRVVHPDLPIRPGTVKLKIDLKTDIALTFLANSLILTPGKTTIDIDKDKGFIYIHWLCVRDDAARASRMFAVVKKFEVILKKVFE